MSTNTYPVFFDSRFLGSSSSLVYEVPASPSTITLQEMQLKLTNVTAATRQVTLFAVPDGDAQGDANAIVKNFSVPPYDFVMVPVTRLGAGGSIEGFCDSASAVTVQTIGGKLHTP